jgi:poly(3-hydroxybutyrate) depolymerase
MSAHRCVRAFSPGRESRQDLGLVLTRYAIERLLYRIGVSRHADYFLLKRALLFDRWFDVPHRPTRAVDLPGFGSAELSLMESTFKEISAIAEDDGMTFDPDTVRATEIRKDAPPTSLYVHSPSCTSPLTACRQAAARRRSRAPPGEIDMGTFRIGRTGFVRLGRAAVALLVVGLAACGGGGGGGAGAGGGTPPPAATAPDIVSQPGAATVTEGAAATFTAAATGTAPLAYQWELSTNGGSIWTNAPGDATLPSYTTAATTLAFNGHAYRVRVSNTAGAVTSTPATLKVNSKAPFPAGLSNQTFAVAGATRQYRVHVPAALSGSPKAIVFVLHGGGGLGLDVANTGAHPLSVFRTVGDREGFVVVYPGGLPATDGEPGWDDCRVDILVASGADDVGFLSALIEHVRGLYGLTRSRIFMAGGSNGAMMAHAFAIQRPDLLAAAATSSGSLAANPKPGPCTAGPTTALPMMIVHGTADPQMPFGGGCVANLGGNCSRGSVVSATATRDRWLAANGLTDTTPTQQVVELDTGDGGPANRFDYAGATPLRWWRLDGAGHTVASRTVLVAPNATTGIQSRDVEFAEIAWDFFAARLPAAASSTPPSTAAIQAARDYNFSVGGQTFIVMHQGQVLEESYANGGAANKVQLLASATKGFTGMLGAIAAADGLFSLDEPVAQRALVEWQSDPQKSKITYRHLLTMTSGLKELNDLAGWNDYLKATVDYPGGSTFVYSGDPNIFGLALERRLGVESVVEYFIRKLFQPLGITSMQWGSNFQDGHPQLSGGAYVTARDWAKFGDFVRKTMDGTWSGPSLLPRAVFDQVFAGNAAHPAYGFYWWLKEPVPVTLAATIDANNKKQFTRQIKPIIDDPRIPDDFVMAAGAYGQRMYVIPSRGLTVVRHAPTGTADLSDVELLGRLLGSGS